MVGKTSETRGISIFVSLAPARAKRSLALLTRSVALSEVSDSASALSTSSNLSKALGAGGVGCAHGMGAPGGQGTFFADAITQAQATLLANHTTGTQAVMILLSDGDAGADASTLTSSKRLNQCKQAVDAATAAKTNVTTKTWIYSVAYSSPTSGGCSTDSPYISPCNTMEAIASDTSSPGIGDSRYFDKSGAGLCGIRRASSAWRWV